MNSRLQSRHAHKGERLQTLITNPCRFDVSIGASLLQFRSHSVEPSVALTQSIYGITISPKISSDFLKIVLISEHHVAYHLEFAHASQTKRFLHRLANAIKDCEFQVRGRDLLLHELVGDHPSFVRRNIVRYRAAPGGFDHAALKERIQRFEEDYGVTVYTDVSDPQAPVLTLSDVYFSDTLFPMRTVFA